MVTACCNYLVVLLVCFTGTVPVGCGEGRAIQTAILTAGTPHMGFTGMGYHSVKLHWVKCHPPSKPSIASCPPA